ncbi:MAG: DUF1579 family protein [Bauldia sp.]
MADNKIGPDIPSPDPALRRLERLVGVWEMKGRPVGAAEDTITGMTTFKWLGHNGSSFFLQQDMDMDYDGLPIKSHELIGFSPKMKTFASTVYSNMSPEPLPYQWDIQGDSITIAVKYGAMDAKFTGTFAADGRSFSGGWRPNPGADPAINAPYDITASRIG